MAQAKAKSNSVVTTQWDASVLTINVIKGQLVGGQPTDAAVMFDMEKASVGNRAAAERHGWTQRLCDRAAKGAPVRQPGMSEEQWKEQLGKHTRSKFDSIAALVAYYESGEVPWKMSGGGVAEGGLLYEALCEHRSDRTPEQIRQFLDSRTPQQLGVVRKIKEVVEIMNRLRIERLGDTDAGGALGDLDSME
jgi:hypothetical protein